MTGIKPPSPSKIWRFSSAHFYRKVISETNNLWYNILEVIQTGKYHRERAEYESHISHPGLYLKNKSNLFLWQGQSAVPCLFFAGPLGDCCIILNPRLNEKAKGCASLLHTHGMLKVRSCCSAEVLTRHIKERVEQKENSKPREDIRVQSFRYEKHDNVFSMS